MQAGDLVSIGREIIGVLVKADFKNDLVDVTAAGDQWKKFVGTGRGEATLVVQTHGPRFEEAPSYKRIADLEASLARLTADYRAVLMEVGRVKSERDTLAKIINDKAWTKKEEGVDTLKKFYVGSPKVRTNGWSKATLAEAVAHAKQRLEETGEEQFIVKVIKVVRKKEQPIVVEDFK